MSLFRVAALLIMCGIALSAVGKPSAPQNSATKQATQPEIAKSIAESVSGTLQFAEGNFLGVAEAMPEDKYSYIPAGGNFDGVRSFGEQVKHVACAQFAFFNEFEGKKPPDDCEKGAEGSLNCLGDGSSTFRSFEILVSFAAALPTIL